MTAKDYATIMSNIVQACRPGTTSIDHFAVIESLNDSKPEPNGVAFYEAGVTHRDDSLTTRSSRVSMYAYCRGDTKQHSLDVAQEVTDSIDYWGGLVLHTYSANVLRSANTTTVRAAGTAHLRNTYGELDADNWVKDNGTGTITNVGLYNEINETALFTNIVDGHIPFDSSGGELHLWVRVSELEHVTEFDLQDDSTKDGIYFEISDDGNWHFYYIDGDVQDEIIACAANTWYHIKIVFVNATKLHSIWVNEVLIINNKSYYDITAGVFTHFHCFNFEAMNTWVASGLDTNYDQESVYVRFAPTQTIPLGVTIISALLNISTTDRIETGSITTQAVEGNASDFSTIALISACSFTSASNTSTFDADSESFSVTSIVQEAYTDGGVALSQIGFRLQPQLTQASDLDISNITLLLQYSISNQPSRIIKQNDGRPLQQNGHWETQIAFNLLYNGVSKNV